MKKELTTKKKVFKYIGDAFTAIIILLVAYILIEVVLGAIRGTPPCIFNHYIFVVATNSMEDTINVGDVVFVRRASFNEVNVNDIISFMDINPNDKVYGQYVTHRAIEFNSLGEIITMGDNNMVPDAYTVTSSNFLGIVDRVSPFLGKVIKLFTGNFTFVFIILMITLGFIIVAEIKNIQIIRQEQKRDAEKEKLKEQIKKEIENDVKKD